MVEAVVYRSLSSSAAVDRLKKFHHNLFQKIDKAFSATYSHTLRQPDFEMLFSD
jgi:hypothetical protein